MKVYIAASFAYADKDKTSQRKYTIDKVVEKIRDQFWTPHTFYVPHRYEVPNAWDISLEEWSQAVYNHDLEQLDGSDLVIFISFGKENNAGAAWEVGYAAAKGKETIVVKMTDEPESLMITSSVKTIIKESEIEDYDWNMRPAYKTGLDKLS